MIILLAEIIAAQIHKINLGKWHVKAKQDTDSLFPLIQQVGSILGDPSHQMYEETAGMKNQVLLRREQLKLRIDQESEKMIKKITEYEARFSSFLGGINYQNKSNKLVETKKSV